jgi:hypothetical protein
VSNPVRPFRHRAHRPSLSRGAAFKNGVWQCVQKNSATKG